MKDVYILMTDDSGTTFSSDEPLDIAVTTEEEAKRYVEEKGVGFSHSYHRVTIFDNKDDALESVLPGWKKRHSKE